MLSTELRVPNLPDPDRGIHIGQSARGFCARAVRFFGAQNSLPRPRPRYPQRPINMRPLFISRTVFIRQNLPGTATYLLSRIPSSDRVRGTRINQSTCGFYAYIGSFLPTKLRWRRLHPCCCRISPSILSEVSTSASKYAPLARTSVMFWTLGLVGLCPVFPLARLLANARRFDRKEGEPLCRFTKGHQYLQSSFDLDDSQI